MDLISRQAAIEALKRAEALTRAFGYHHVIETIRELPTADLSEYCDKLWKTAYERGKAEAHSKKGKWIHVGYIENTWRVSKCSICESQTIDAGNYCPNCGCRMTEGEEDGRE